MTPPIQIRTLDVGDEAVFERVAPDVFDGPLVGELVNEFLSDVRHHIAVAIDDGTIVGMATAVHYVHPDKPPELWINEVGVASSHRGLGLGKRLLEAVFQRGKQHGCRTAWVLTDGENMPAGRLYASVGGLRAQGRTELYEFHLSGDPRDQHDRKEP